MDYQLINNNHFGLTPTETILVNRGIPLNELEHYLHTTDKDILDPKLLHSIKDGAKLLIQHISNNDRLMVQVDSDCDGFTSAALLINYLHDFFPSFVEHNIVYRLHEGKEHGIITDTVPNGIKLVIVPDAGSMDLEQHEILHDRGIDVLVLDHHVVTELSQYACIINNQLDDYPNPALSGVGVVYKFCCYIDSLLGLHNADNYLDLVALGNIADMISLRSFETKRLIEKGLDNIQNPFFEAMVEKQSYSLQDSITPIGIAFYIAPYINATIRMGTPNEKLVLFESMLKHKALEEIPSTKRGCAGQMEMRVTQACRNCTNVKNRQTKARDKSLEQIEEIIEEQNLLQYKVLIVKLTQDQEVEKNLTGLIANQLMAKYMRPVLLLNELDDGSWAGSARGYGKSKLKDFRQFIEDSQLANYATG